MTNLKNKFLTKIISLILAQAFLLTGLVYPETSNNISSIYINAKGLRVPMMGSSKSPSLKERIYNAIKIFGRVSAAKTIYPSITRMFRYPKQLAILEEVLPYLIKNKNISALSLGSSTGEEAVSIAVTIISFLIRAGIAKKEWPNINVQGFEFKPRLVKRALEHLTKGGFKGDADWPNIENEWLKIISDGNVDHSKIVNYKNIDIASDEAIEQIKKADLIFFNMVAYQLSKDEKRKMGRALQDTKPGARIFTTEKKVLLEVDFGIDLAGFSIEELYDKKGKISVTYLVKKDKTAMAIASGHTYVGKINRREFMKYSFISGAGLILGRVGLSEGFGASLDESRALGRAYPQQPAVIPKDVKEQQRRKQERGQQRREVQQMEELQKNNTNNLSQEDKNRVNAFLTGNRRAVIEFAAKKFNLEPELLAGYIYEEELYKENSYRLFYSVKERLSEITSWALGWNGTHGIGQVNKYYMMQKEFLKHLIEHKDYFLKIVRSKDDKELLNDFYKIFYDASFLTEQEIQNCPRLMVNLAGVEEINILLTAFVIRSKADGIVLRNRGDSRIPDASTLEQHSREWLVTRWQAIPQGKTTAGDLSFRYARPFGGKDELSWRRYYYADTRTFMVMKAMKGEDLDSPDNERSLKAIAARNLFYRWGGFKEADKQSKSGPLNFLQNFGNTENNSQKLPKPEPEPSLTFKIPSINSPAKHFSLRSKGNSVIQDASGTPDTGKFKIGDDTRLVEGLDLSTINYLGSISLQQNGQNITFTIRGPTERTGLFNYLREHPAILQEAISRSNALHNGELRQEITIVLADKYDYLAGDHKQNNLIILNASDLNTMLSQDANPAFTVELITALLSEELSHERGAQGDVETEERLAQDGAHHTKYAFRHQPYGPALSGYIDFLERYAFEAKGERGYLNYLKATNRYQDLTWTKNNAPLVADRTSCVFQMEMALSKAFLDNLYNKLLQKGYTKKAAEFAVGRIAQLTMAGGLGNIKDALDKALSEKGVNQILFSPLYSRWIKGVGDIDNSLIEAVLEQMGEPVHAFKVNIFRRDNVNETMTVDVKIYRDPFSPSNYWIHCPEIFDGAYPDDKVYLAQQLILYRKAVLGSLSYLHSKGEIKDKLLFSLSEVYTAFLIPDVIEDEYTNNPLFKDIFKHHYNHTVVAAGMPTLPEALYRILGIKEKYRSSIIKIKDREGKLRDISEGIEGERVISLADLIGLESDIITGCSKAHTYVLKDDVMPKYKHKIPENISEANSEGSFVDNWQGEEIQKVYERYYLILDAEDDADLFRKLDQDQAARERFITDMMSAKERQQKASREWLASYGVNLKDDVKIASLVRRMVRYKRLDVLVAMLGIPKYREQLEKELGFLVGGRTFDRDKADFGATQLNAIRKLLEKFPGLISYLPDNTDYPGYNIFNAHNIYELVYATIMLSDKDLEAGPTSPTKGLINLGIMIAVMDGVMKELLIDFTEDPVNGNGFRVDYHDPAIQGMARDFLQSVNDADKEKVTNKGDHITPFAFHTSNGIVHAKSAGLKEFFKTLNELLDNRIAIFNQSDDYINYMIGLFEGIKGAERIISWLKETRDNKDLESYEKYEDIRSFVIEMLGAKAEPTMRSLFKTLKSFNEAWSDPEKKRRLIYNAFKTGMLKANTSTSQGPGLIKLWEQGLERELYSDPSKILKNQLLIPLESFDNAFDFKNIYHWLNILDNSISIPGPEGMGVFESNMHMLSPKEMARIAYHINRITKPGIGDQEGRGTELNSLMQFFNMPEFYKNDVLSQLSLLAYLATYCSPIASSLEELKLFLRSRESELMFKLIGDPVQDGKDYIFTFQKEGFEYMVKLKEDFTLELVETRNLDSNHKLTEPEFFSAQDKVHFKNYIEAGYSDEQILEMIENTQREFLLYTIDELREEALALLNNPENDNFELKNKHSLADILANHCIMLDRLNLRDSLERRREKALASAQKQIRIWEAIARLAHLDPYDPEEESVYDWLMKYEADASLPVLIFKQLVREVSRNTGVDERDIMGSLDGKSILDIGCGDKRELINWLRRNTKDAAVFGIDPALPKGLEARGLFRGTLQGGVKDEGGLDYYPGLKEVCESRGIKFDVIVSRDFFSSEVLAAPYYRGDISAGVYSTYANVIREVLKSNGIMYIEAGINPNKDFEEAFKNAGFKVTRVSSVGFYILSLESPGADSLQDRLVPADFARECL